MPGKFKFLTICLRPNRDSKRHPRSSSPHFFRPPPSPIKTKPPRCTQADRYGAAAIGELPCENGDIELVQMTSARVKVRQPHSMDVSCKMAAPTRIILLACGSFNPITNMHLRMFEIARDYLHHKERFQVIGGILSPVNDGYKKKGLLSSKHRIEMCKLAIEHSDWLRTDTWEAEQPDWVETVKVLRHHDNEINCNKMNNNPDLPLPPPARCLATPTRRGTKRRRNLRKNEPPVSNEPESDDTYSVPNLNANPSSAASQAAAQPGVQLKLLCGADLLESFAVPGLWKTEDLETIVGKHGLVVITRNGSDPSKFIYESDLLYKYSNNIHIVTEWIYNEISSTKIRTAVRRNESVKYLIPDAVMKYVHNHGLYREMLTPSAEKAE